MKVSILSLTIDRFDILQQCYDQNIKNCGIPRSSLELLVADNGSSDERVKYFWKNYVINYFRNNITNEGVGHAFNQLYLRSTGDYLAFVGTDILMPNNWLTMAIQFIDRTPNAGMVGINWGHSGIPPLTEKFGIKAHWLNEKLNRVFGTWIMKRSVVENIGLFYTGFDVYGLEDSEFNDRVNRSGYNSFYLPDMMSKHLCNDVGQTSEYRKMKDKSLENNWKIFSERIASFDRGESLKAELPKLIDPR